MHEVKFYSKSWTLRFMRGWLHDMEDWKYNHRVGLVQQLLKKSGITTTFAKHAETCPVAIYTTRPIFDRVHSTCPGCNCAAERPIFPAWVDAEIIDAAFRLADVVQEKRGAWHRNAAYNEKLERDRATI